MQYFILIIDLASCSIEKQKSLATSNVQKMAISELKNDDAISSLICNPQKTKRVQSQESWKLTLIVSYFN